jgi:hypothetical protein
VGMQLRGSASTIPGGRTSKMAFPVWRLGTRNEKGGVWTSYNSSSCLSCKLEKKN